MYWIHDGQQRLLCRSDNWATDLYQRLNAFRPLLLDAAMDAQRIYGTHEVNFLTRPLVRIKTTERSRRDAEGSNRSCQKVIKSRQWPCLNLLRVSDAGQRQRRDIHRWPASESRQGKNPRGMGRGECRALRYGDLADAEGASAGAPRPLRRFVTWQAGSDSSG